MKVFFTSGMILFLVLLILCQVRFYVENKIKLDDARGVFLFMNKIMHQSTLLTNISASFFFIACVMALALSWVMGESYGKIISYCISMFGIVFLFLHCRFFSIQKDNADKLGFIKELFFRYEVSSNSILIWIARLSYLISIFMLFYYGVVVE